MAEEVAVGAQPDAPEASPEDRMAALFGGNPVSKPAPAPEAPSESEPEREPPVDAKADDEDADASDDLSPDDLPEEDEAPAETAAAELELTYNGEPLKVTMDEARNLAQLGYHLKQNQDRISSEVNQAQELAAKVQQHVQFAASLTPEMRKADIEASSLYAQLQQIDRDAVARLAVDDAAQYVQVQAQIDALERRAQAAVQHRDQVFGQFRQAQEQVEAQTLQFEATLLQKSIPAFRDEAQVGKAKALVAESLKTTRDATRALVVKNAELMAMAYKAARYDQLQAGKKDKLSKASEAPQVAKPGVTNLQPQNVTRAKALRSKLHKSGSLEDAASLLEIHMR